MHRADAIRQEMVRVVVTEQLCFSARAGVNRTGLRCQRFIIRMWPSGLSKNASGRTQLRRHSLWQWKTARAGFAAQAVCPIIVRSSIDFSRQPALPLHKAYQAEAPAAEKVIAKLREMRILREACDEPTEALQLLARSDEPTAEPMRLEDDDLLALRDAWAQLARDERRTMGAKIGANIELRTITYVSDSQRPERTWARPHEVYLPAQIARETALRRLPAEHRGCYGLILTMRRCSSMNAGRTEAGAQRFLSALGVSRDPRLISELR